MWSLTPDQAAVLREATAAPGGVYVPITGPFARLAYELIAGGAADTREEVFTTCDPKHGPGARTDYYLVPTEWGMALLRNA
jgi:hypothetical protein